MALGNSLKRDGVAMKSRNQAGFTALELVVVTGLMSIVGSYVYYDMRSFVDPLTDASQTLVAHIKRVKGRAIATTSAYKLSVTTNKTIIPSYGDRCTSDTFTPELSEKLTLSAGVTFADDDWEVCFDPRGMPNTNIEIELTKGAEERTVEVLLGGAIRERN
jgi:prepilin-type N-terminal cleavage/methylation domain-containing protein